MKNKLLSMGLVAGFTLSTLAACGKSYTKPNKDADVVATFDGEEIKISDLSTDWKKDSGNLQIYYDAIKEVLTRKATEDYLNDPTYQNKLDSEMKSFVETVKNGAKNNGISYKAELNSQLKNKGVESLDEYKEKISLELLQKELERRFLDDKTEEILQEYIDSAVPYHVSHILFNVSAANNSYSNAKITKEEALGLGSLVSRLAGLKYNGTAISANEKFAQIAKQSSADNGSAAEFGNLGIMSRTTSFVNEFQLGVYAYESLYRYDAGFVDTDEGNFNRVDLFTDATGEGSKEKKYLTGIPTAAATSWKSRSSDIRNANDDDDLVRRENGIGYIPFSAAGLIADFADITEDSNNNKVNDGDEDYYPRNVYFNNFFNDHGISVIYNDVPGSSNGNFVEVNDKDGNPLFGGKKVLCADGNPDKVILVTRAGSSYEGIHFIVVEKSPINTTKADLKAYWDDRTPEELTKDGEESLIGKTYVTNFTSSDSKDYTERQNKIMDAVKGFDEMLDARIFEYYIGTTQLQIKDPVVKANIEEYITRQRGKNLLNSIDVFENRWNSYVEQLKQQDKDQKNFTLPLICATKYQNAGTASEYADGGVCYGKK